MKEYCCDKCGKEFMQKIDLIRHLGKKYPCVSEHELTIMIASNNEDLMRLEALFNKLRNILRDHESITGKDALDIFSDILFLRLINPMLKKTSKGIYFNIVDYEYTNERANKYKQYIIWNNIIEHVKKIKKEDELEDKEELLIIVQTIFNIIFKLHPETKSIFCDKLFNIKKSITLVKMFEEINKINFEEMDVDVKGKAYELTIQKEASVSKDFGQFFTPRWVVKYIINQLNPVIAKDGSFDKVMDPACGTGGFISEYYKFVKNKAEKDDITLKKNSGSNLYGYEIVPKTRELALINLLLNTGVYNENIKGEDFLENSKDFVKDKFKGHIITNPPFSMDKDYKSLFSKGEKNDYGKILPVDTKSGTFLFLQACSNMIEDGYNICMVSPNGKEIFGKGKDHIEVRRNIVNTCDLYKIALLPSQSFKPYTGVETLVLFMKKGTKTKEINFVQLVNTKDIITEKSIIKVKYDQLKDKNYSWNYKDYLVEDITKNDSTLEYQNFGELFTLLPTTKHVSSIGKSEGIYRFYNSSQSDKLYVDKYEVEEESIIIGNGGNMCIHIDKYFTPSKHVTVCQLKKKENLIKYIYYYVLLNFESLKNKSSGSIINWLNKESIKSLKIPVPPLDVQEQIVKELDSYYKTKEAIQIQLNEMSPFKNGKFQMLLNQCSNVENIKMGNICDFKTGKFNSKDKQDTGKYKFFTSDAIQPAGYTDNYCFEGKKYVILIKDGGSGSKTYGDHIGLGKVFLIENEKTSATSHQLAIFINNGYNIKFLYIWLKNNKNTIMDLAHYTTGLGCISMEKLKNLEVNIPIKEDQEKIIKEMEKDDNLEKLLNEKLKEVDTLIKNRFDYYINKCKHIDKTKEKLDISTNDSDDEETKPKKVNKKITIGKKIPINNSIESESSSDDESIEVKPKKKVTKRKNDNDSEDEKPKKVNKK